MCKSITITSIKRTQPKIAPHWTQELFDSGVHVFLTGTGNFVDEVQVTRVDLKDFVTSIPNIAELELLESYITAELRIRKTEADQGAPRLTFMRGHKTPREDVNRG